MDSKGRYVNGKLFVTGGYNGSDINVLKEYDTATNTWTERNNMPTARGWIGTVALNGKINVARGNSSNERYFDLLEIYVP